MGVLVLLTASCRKDFEFEPSTGSLQFSRDTVYLDTVFTNIGSSTYNLKVYNRSNEDIRIPVVRLSQGESSRYRLNVDGRAGKEFTDVEILAKDSIFVFVETTVDINDFVTSGTQFLYTDAIEFDSGALQQKVELVTLVQDAVFLFPDRVNGIKETILLDVDDEGNETRIEGFFLEDDELTFTNEKPYVIYGYAGVAPGKTMTVEAGVRLHFHRDSGIIVANGGTLQVNGALSSDPELLENEVIFEGDRLEPGFANVPGQWGTVWLTAGSTGHNINHLTIKNATVGMLMDSNDGTANSTLTLKNTQIYNSANVGLWARTGYVDAENLVVGNSGQVSFYANIGGRYNFRHCTFANFWNNSFRNTPALLIDNYIELENGQVFAQDLTEANFTNCIVYGNNNLELLFDPVESNAFNYRFKNCLIRFNDANDQFATNPLYDFDNPLIFENNLFNENPIFRNTAREDFLISINSPANGAADIPTALLVPIDILGINRTASPDMGAYESVDFEE